MGVKLSVKIEYSCRVLAQMAQLHQVGELAHIDSLAQIEQIPSNYLAQILTELRNAGLITSKRGKRGGYLLARAPAEISLRDIIEAIDGDILSYSRNADGASATKVEEALGQWKESLEESAAGIRLDRMAASEASGMYYI